jgi:hypothetical protein
MTRIHARTRSLIVVLILIGVASSCSVERSTSPTSPTSPTSNTLTGTWSGNLSLLGVTGQMTWTLTQTDASVTGPVLVLLPTGTVLLNGALAGTLSGSTLTYVINIGPGAIPSQPTCVGQLGGTTTVAFSTPSTLAGSYSVNSSTCQTPFSNGTFTLTRS